MSESSNRREAPDVLIARARQGNREALGALLELYRNYLYFMSRKQIRTTLKLAVNPSTLVQETVMDACRAFEHFRGTTGPELIVWLRQILVRNLIDLERYHTAEKRDFRRQRSLEARLKRSSMAVHHTLAAGISSPSSPVAKREQAVLAANALARLPKHYQQVIELRILDDLPFSEVARRMKRPSAAVQKLLARALLKLRSVMKEAE